MSSCFIVVFNKIAPSKITFTNFFTYKWKFVTKINRVTYARLGSFNFGTFCARYKVLHI